MLLGEVFILRLTLNLTVNLLRFVSVVLDKGSSIVDEGFALDLGFVVRIVLVLVAFRLLLYQLLHHLSYHVFVFFHDRTIRLLYPVELFLRQNLFYDRCELLLLAMVVRSDLVQRLIHNFTDDLLQIEGHYEVLNLVNGEYGSRVDIHRFSETRLDNI